MKVLLIDIDSLRENLALMQISSYHKSEGDEVSFDITDPDKIYVSCIFKKNRTEALSAGGNYQNAERFIGGSGINYNWLPGAMQKVTPDYSLYPHMKHSLGFTTRGCIRKCPWCIVPQKEGKLQRWQHPEEFHHHEFDTINILDNNWLADRKWFMETSEWILERNLKLIENGLDIRLIDNEIAKRLKEMKHAQTIHFAFDTVRMEKAVRKGIKILKDHGFDIKHNVQFYVLVGYNTTEDQDKYRCRLLKELGTVHSSCNTKGLPGLASLHGGPIESGSTGHVTLMMWTFQIKNHLR